MKVVDVLIVGGGVAGVAAASRLISKGIDDVLVLEAQDRLGGRIWTKPLGDGCVDMGAHWVHGQGGNPIYEMVEPLGLVESDCGIEKHYFMKSDGSEVDATVANELYEKWMVELADREKLLESKGSLYDYMKPKFEEMASGLFDEDLRKAFFEWFLRYECSVDGCYTIKDVSASGVTRYKDAEGDNLIVWKENGYSSIIEILLNRHPACAEGDPIELEKKTIFNCQVQEIDWSADEVVVKCNKGGLYRAKHVVVTTSLGYLKANHKEMFDPPLPKNKINAIRSLGFGAVAKVYLQFPSQWWPDACNGFSFIYTDSEPTQEGEMGWEKQFIGLYSEKSAPNVLCGWLIGDAAREMEMSTHDQVISGCKRVLMKFLGSKYDILEPIAMLRSEWSISPFFEGSYSFHSLEADKVNASASDLATPLVNSSGKEVVLFAGEASHPYFYSTVHGAMETGWREADRIIAASKK